MVDLLERKVYIQLPRLFPNGSFRELPVETSTIAFEDSNPSASSSTPVVYCLPGIGDFRHSYRFLAPLLQNAGYRIIAQDLRGMGDSGTEFQSYSIESIASDILTVLNACHIIGPVLLIGNSLSAACAVTVAVEHPTRFMGIVTLGGFFRDMPKDTFIRPMSYLLFNRLWGQAAWVSTFKSFFVNPPTDLSEYTEAVKAKMLSDSSHVEIIGSMFRATRDDAWKKIESVELPVLLIAGSRDPDLVDPIKEMDFVASHLTKSRRVEKVIIDQAGHYPHVEMPEEVNRAILCFVQSIS